MKKILFFAFSIILLTGISGCKDDTNVGTICMGDDIDTLFESLPWETKKMAKKGDIIATKNPGVWIDFNYPVAFNQYNTAFGKFAGLERKFLTKDGKILTIDEFIKKSEEESAKQKK